ncbi:hypothetical protein MSG28_010600 [Choristoneura fumiferana]|uniref:Uncharacterized protein n=1 Tax=Choristoneura fumiferana TaxID=7141 RepID=A0ACC0KNN3_CHOFU|nr:hypothetical protein MSG28_010600 [Choristoneura fumiferana]
MINDTSEATSVTVARPSSSETNQREPFIISRCQRSTEEPVNNNGDDETDETDEEEKLLTVYCRSGKLGAAYYTIQTGELFILDELPDRPPDFPMFTNLFRQVDPVRILLDGRTQSAFVNQVKKTVFDDGNGDGGKCKLVFLASKEYSFEACKRRIYSLSLPTEPTDCTDTERTLFLRTVVDFNQTQTVHALGALLRYLDLNWSNLNLDLQSKPQFLSLRRISLKDIVTIDEDTYRGLQIFSTISHPSNFKKGVQGSNKEGLSLFHLFSSSRKSTLKLINKNVTKDRGAPRLRSRHSVEVFKIVNESSTLSANKLLRSLAEVYSYKGMNLLQNSSHSKPNKLFWTRVLMQHPTTDLDTLKRRQDAVEFFMKPQNDTIVRNMCSSLRYIRNVNTLYNAVLICEMCENTGNSSEFLEQLGSFDNHKLYEMALYMNRIVDFDLSKTERKFTVKAGVDQELDMSESI